MDIKYIKLNIDMSPRAFDELKALYTGVKGSKYELPSLLFPEGSIFTGYISIVDGLVWINIFCRELSIILKGILDGADFHCRSISRGSIKDGRMITLSFIHRVEDKTQKISPELKKRLDMWYEYIEILLKKSRENSYRFTYEETVSQNGERLCIRVSGENENPQVKNLSVSFSDEKGEPSFFIGKALRYENDTLTISTSKSQFNLLSKRTDIIVYDAASFITCKRMKSGLDKLCKGECANNRLSDFLFNPSKANTEVRDNVILSQEDLLMKNMNTEQIKAVEGVLNSNDLYLIQGPPGTGKTTVIAEICYQNAVRGLKTLVVSQSNLAVDNAISRVMNHNDIRVLRKGDTSRVEDEGLPFVEDNVVNTWITRVSDSAGKMAESIDSKLSILKKYKNNLPEILKYAEAVNDNQKVLSQVETQLFFHKNVMDDAKSKREDFFELINSAYDKEDIEIAYSAMEIYPSDFKIPNSIYNDASERYADIKTDVDKVHELEKEIEILNGYTERFVKQLGFISRHVSNYRLEDTAFEGIFYYTDHELSEKLLAEGERIINSIPYGIKSIIFRPSWGKVAAIYYRRAESFLNGILHKVIKLCNKINVIETNEDYLFNLESFRISLDALCQDYDSQYYSVKTKYNNILEELGDAQKDYDYSVQLFKEKISPKFYSSALDSISAENPDLYEIERLVNEQYVKKAERYIKWQGILKEWCVKINGNNMNYGALKKLYIDNANVIGITCIQSGTVDFEKNYPSFDVVIIDESSKSTPPDIILPMLKGKKIVLVGDHKQLPPYIDSDAYDEIDEQDDKLRKLMKISLFEELYESAPNNMRTMLFRQYRMHRDIAGLINQFYINTDAGRLESPSEALKNHCCEGGDISYKNHVIWYDVKNSPEYYESRLDKSFYNKYEADCIIKILSKLNDNLKMNNAYKTVGIITFYDAQVRLIEEKVSRYKFENMELRIGSVDRFQGMEEEIIIISFVRNNEMHNIGFAKDSRRINVALSRAKELLVIVGSSENFIHSFDVASSKMFSEIYENTKILSGLRNPEELNDVSTCEKTVIEYHKPLNATGMSYTDDDTEQQDSGDINILDYFILKSAYEFKNRRLTIGNISSVLGIAPIFVKNRTAYLISQKCVLCEKGLVKILENGEKMLQMSDFAE